MDNYIVMFMAGVFLLINLKVAVSIIDFCKQGSRYFRKMNKKLDTEKYEYEE